jgi:hypothetical protein
MMERPRNARKKNHRIGSFLIDPGPGHPWCPYLASIGKVRPILKETSPALGPIRVAHGIRIWRFSEMTRSPTSGRNGGHAGASPPNVDRSFVRFSRMRIGLRAHGAI